VRVGPELAATAVEPVPGERPPPPRIDCLVGAMLSLEKAGLPPSLLASVKHLASLHNPTFYERQKLRLSTYQTPRFIKCYQEDLSHLHLPRGVLEQLRSLLRHAGSELVVTDHRPSLAPLSLRFHGRLTALQATAVDTILGYDHGVLVAPPGTGKTVMGAAIIAARNLPTLVLVHRKPLLDQWRVQLVETLGLSSNQVGQIGGGRTKPTGMVDLAMIQSLSRLDNPEGLFQRYGAIVIDECHHVPAFSFESCVRRAPARHVLGLTATPYRRDGLQGIITMQCGPIRHMISTRDAEPDAPRPHLRVRTTDFGIEEADDTSIQEVFRALVNDQARTALVCEGRQDARLGVAAERNAAPSAPTSRWWKIVWTSCPAPHSLSATKCKLLVELELQPGSTVTSWNLASSAASDTGRCRCRCARPWSTRWSRRSACRAATTSCRCSGCRAGTTSLMARFAQG